jgi:hypothetical protein
MDTRTYEVSSVVVDGEQWTEVDANVLANASSQDRVYSLDRREGTVTFGDGVHGRQPPTGAHITVTYQYRSGKDGNVPIALSISSTWPFTDDSYLVSLNRKRLQVRFIGPVVESPSGNKRPCYFDGELLSTSDFSDEQAYFVEMHRRHNRFLHSPGVVNGLEIHAKDESVVISPGYALDCYGRELILKEAIELAIKNLESPLYVTIEYTEKQTDEIPLDNTIKPASRIEDCVLAYMVSKHEQRDALTVGRLIWATGGWHVDTTFKPPRSVRGEKTDFTR